MAISSVEPALPAGDYRPLVDGPAADQGVHEQPGHRKGLFVRATPGPAAFFDRRVASAGLGRPRVNYGHSWVGLTAAPLADPLSSLGCVHGTPSTRGRQRPPE